MKLKKSDIGSINTSNSIFRACWKKNKSIYIANSDGFFPDDIIFELLLLLPLQSLVRLSCVSKSWRNFITSDETFIRSRLDRAKDKGHLEVLMYSNRNYGGQDEACFQGFDSPAIDDRLIKQRKSMELPNPLYIGQNFLLAGCCDGLICYYRPNSSAIYLWNPALHQCRKIPIWGTYDFLYHSDFVGFGYDPQNRDFKVVNIRLEGTGKAELYSLKRDSWKSIAVTCTEDLPINYLRLTSNHPPLSFNNGCLHWIGKRENDFSIVVFGISNEKLDLLKIPSSVSKSSKYFPCLGVLEGRLSLIATANWREWEVWSMKTYGVHESWMRTTVIESFSDPIGFSLASGGVLLLRGPHSVFSYNPRSSESSEKLELDLLGNRSRFDHYFIANYVESLISTMSPLPKALDPSPLKNLEKLCSCFGPVVIFVLLFVFYAVFIVLAWTRGNW